MKKLLIVIGALFIVIIIFAAVAFGILTYHGSKLDKESSSYANEAVTAIATDWSEKALLDRASPELKHVTTIDQLNAYFARCSKLGRLQHAESVKGEARISFHPRMGMRIQAQYTAKAHFENAEATICLGLIKHGGNWQIGSFNVR